MEIILLERVAKLGQIGDVVRVKGGYARNFLLPAGKALRATESNREIFEQRRDELEARNLELRKEAEAVAERLAGREFVIIRSASGVGSLYGSVTARDIWQVAADDGVSLQRQQILLLRPIKELGMHDISIALHPEVDVSVKVNVARSEEEAALQAKGVDVTATDEDEDQEDQEATEPEAVSTAEDIVAEPDAVSADSGESESAAEEAGEDSSQEEK